MVLPFQNLRKKILGWMIVESVPILNLFRSSPPWPYSLEQLRYFPTGSWGKELAAMLDSHKLGLLPKYETHDALHILLGYRTTVTGELRLQAFMLGNRSASNAGFILLFLGLIFLPESYSKIMMDFERGRQATRVAEWNIAGLLDNDLGFIESRLNLSCHN